MTSSIESFKKLHNGSKAFILPNAWDAHSASVLQQAGYPAVGTSSAAVAATLGYNDGEQMPFNEYLMIIRRITATVTIPVTVDIEMGYGETPEDICSNINKLIDLGVVGINIEDSLINGGTRELKDANEFAKLLSFVRSKIKSSNQSLFMNIRCDTYLVNPKDVQKETSARIKVYEAAGADGIFLPFIRNEQDIAAAVQSTSLPINVMTIPSLPDVSSLNKLGVKRISMGPFLHARTFARTLELAKDILENNTLKSIL